MSRAADRDPAADDVCGAWGPLQGQRDPARCQAEAGHDGEHYAYTSEGDRGPRWRTPYIPLEAPNGDVFYTLPPDGRRGRLPRFYREHPGWTDWRDAHEAGQVDRACRNNGIGVPDDEDDAPADSPGFLETDELDELGFKPRETVRDGPDSTKRTDEPEDATPSRIDPATTHRLAPYRKHPTYTVCVDEHEHELEEDACNRYWIDDDDTVHVCQQDPETCRARPAERTHRHECPCGTNRTGQTYPLEAPSVDEQPLDAYPEASEA